jgi:hypothetical protein
MRLLPPPHHHPSAVNEARENTKPSSEESAKKCVRKEEEEEEFQTRARMVNRYLKQKKAQRQRQPKQSSRQAELLQG